MPYDPEGARRIAGKIVEYIQCLPAGSRLLTLYTEATLTGEYNPADKGKTAYILHIAAPPYRPVKVIVTRTYEELERANQEFGQMLEDPKGMMHFADWYASWYDKMWGKAN